MKCQHCGAENVNATAFCENCGQPMAPQNAQPTQYTQPQYAQPQYTQPNQYGQPAPMYNAPADPYNGHSMKWYKFLVYFALIASAIGYIWNAITTFGTGNYTVELTKDDKLTGKEAKDWMYENASGLKTADLFYGICLIISAVLVLAAWYYLFKRKKQAPMIFYISYAFSSAISAIYSFWAYSTAKDVLKDPETVITSAITTVVFGVVMIIVNYIYFNKRKDIFVN